MTKTIKPWRCTHFPDKVTVPTNHVLITMSGVKGGDSTFSLCVPLSGFYTRNANIHRYGRGMKEYFADGKFLGVFPAYREKKTRILYENDRKDTMLSYLSGTWRWNNRKTQQNQIAI